MSVYDNVSDLFGLALLVGEELEAAQELVAQQKAKMGLSTIEGEASNVLDVIAQLNYYDRPNSWYAENAVRLGTLDFEKHVANENLKYFQGRVEEEIAKAAI